ncbi:MULTISPECIES: hypothetical protein [Pseudomonas]|jgi:hypothetical protein|uniref:Uncharacterized protein n=1 Tax=Pseudomonas gingeri TaxID=117681 RepID=A0A7Y7WVJ6_9PSED|nr:MULTISPECIES: hypothetical protein [Pseudomonas]NWB45683.1 hypothetical protein [Pseudomonas gingeri]NWB88180.1 hypothetical protein [Pseudomonas gingeri]
MDEKKSVLGGKYILLSVILGIVFAGFFLRKQYDPLTMSIDHFRQVVAVGGSVGLIAKLISTSGFAGIRKIASVLMGVACSTIGMTWVMLFYIAKG